MKFWIDGSGWNGKKCSYCVIINSNPNTIIIKEFQDKCTNNQMEYQGLIHALGLAKDGDEIITDSQLITGQMTMKWKINHEHLRVLNEQAKQIWGEKKIKLTWVPREENLAGIHLDKLKGR